VQASSRDREKRVGPFSERRVLLLRLEKWSRENETFHWCPTGKFYSEEPEGILLKFGRISSQHRTSTSTRKGDATAGPLQNKREYHDLMLCHYSSAEDRKREGEVGGSFPARPIRVKRRERPFSQETPGVSRGESTGDLF